MPNEINPGMRIDFKQNSADGFTASGMYHGVISYRSYGYGNDLSGGPAFQLAISDAGNLWIRKSTGPTSWSAWGKTDSADYVSSWIRIAPYTPYAVYHGLGTTPSRVLYQFSSDGGGTIVYEGWGWYDNSWKFVKTDSPYNYYDYQVVSIMTGSSLRAGGDTKPEANYVRFLVWK